MIRNQLMLATSVAMSAVCVSGAQAQDANLFARDRNVAVDERGRPEFEALGVRAGGLMLYPKLQVDLGYDSNVAAEDADERSDAFVRVSPRVDLESNWSRHALNGNLRGAFTRFGEYDEENTDTWGAGLNGRIDVRRFTRITLGSDYAANVEPRTSSNSPGLIAEPIEYDVVGSNLGIVHTVNRLRATGRFDVRAFDYQDGRTRAGTLIEQDDRDQTTYDLTLRADYAVSPATAVFARVVFNDRKYDQALSATTPLRDSSGYNAVVGVNFELSDLIRGEAGVGYLEQTFDNPIYGDLTGLSANARLEYFATPLLTLGLTADRSIGDSGIVGTAGFLTTTVQATADYELRRNILVGGRLGLTVDTFDSIDRENERLFAGVRATYLLNRRIGLTASYDYETRESQGFFATNDFTSNRVLFSVVAQY